MSIKDEYLQYRNDNRLKTRVFGDRVKLQMFLRDHIEEIWAQNPGFANGGMFKNHMTGRAIGFAYYDCRPSAFCKARCYGFSIGGVFDYNMLKLGVIASESLKSADSRYIEPLLSRVRTLSHVKIGHWGDAVPEQVPVIASLARNSPGTVFWWYTRKIEIAQLANATDLPNLRAYLSLDPTTYYPSPDEYPYGITYLLGNDHFHQHHKEILRDKRLVAVFPLKKGGSVENPSRYGLLDHPRICEEKARMARLGKRGDGICLSCEGRCNYDPSLSAG